MLVIVSCNKNDPKPDDSGLFIKFFGTAVTNAGYAMAEVGDGFVLVGASVLDENSRTDTDILIVKTDRNGNRLWEKRIATLKNEIAHDVKINGNGEIFLLGGQAQATSDSMDMLLVQLNPDGSEINRWSYGADTSSEVGYSINFLENDTLLLAGTKTYGTDRDMTVLKVRGTHVSWQRVIGIENQNDDLNRVIAAGDGRFIWCSTAYKSATESNVRVAISDPDGLLDWQYEFGQFNNIKEFGRDVVQAPDGNFVVVGSRGDKGRDTESLWLLKININGALIWESQPAGNATSGYSIRNTSDGGFIVGGYTSLTFTSEPDANFLLLKLNASGGSEWSKNYGGARYDVATQAMQTSDGGYIMLGLADMRFNNAVFALIKTDNEGNINKKK